jgi:GDP-L-fucose synthase
MQHVYSLAGKRTFVAGHRGMVGSALVRALVARGVPLLTAARAEVDLRNQRSVGDWFAANRPEAVFVAAATVGGILANASRPAEFIYDNLMIEANLIEAAYRNRVERLVFLGSSCIYPKHAHQPMAESELLTGPLEPTNQWYAVAKIAGIKLVQAYRQQYGCSYISIMPTNLYGPGDNFELQSAHVIPALMRKADTARREKAGAIEVWGTGQARREFLYVEDLADAVLFLAEHYDDDSHINVGTGSDLTIAELAREICHTVGFRGEIVFDRTKPDGTPRKLLDVSRLTALGWTARTPLRQGLERTYDAFRGEAAVRI